MQSLRIRETVASVRPMRYVFALSKGGFDELLARTSDSQ
jgi:hypothetical protein